MADLSYFPFRGLARLDPFGREIEDLFKGFLFAPASSQQMAAGQFPIDVSEDEQRYMVRAEIPGFNKADLHVSVNGEQVLISAETKQVKEGTAGSQVVLKECYYGRQYRAFSLPQMVDDAGSTAKYEDGVLQLVLPKKGNDTARTIVID